MRPRPIWFTPRVDREVAALAYRLPIGWLVTYAGGDRIRWQWVLRLYWSNHYDRL